MRQAERYVPQFLVFLLVSTPVFALFSYNSGYGYDQLEYLVLGRAMTEGIPLYTYLPSKGPAIYYFVALLYRIGFSMQHVSLALVIASLYAAMVTATYLVLRRWFSGGIALIAAILVGNCAAFMELNFLQPTPFVYLAGLVAYDATLRFLQNRRLIFLFFAGIALGAGIVFKATTAFYGLALTLILCWEWLRQRSTFLGLLQQGIVLAFGAAVAPLLFALYFFSQGRLADYWQWSFIFPLLHYPASTTYVAKFYTKLLWVHLAVLGALVMWATSAQRRALLRAQPGTGVALVFGVCAYLALFKTQSSHYFFPGAPFLLLFALTVYGTLFEADDAQTADTVAPADASGSPWKMARLIGAGAAVLILLVVSGVLYRPDAAKRFVQVRQFDAEEQPFQEFVQSRVDANHYVLFSGGALISMWGYWVSHRYPPPPFIAADVKTIWMLRNRPESVYTVLRNPKLELVQFEPDEVNQPRLEDVFGDQPSDSACMAEYLRRVRLAFEPLKGLAAADSPINMTFWVPRG